MVHQQLPVVETFLILSEDSRERLFWMLPCVMNKVAGIPIEVCKIMRKLVVLLFIVVFQDDENFISLEAFCHLFLTQWLPSYCKFWTDFIAKDDIEVSFLIHSSLWCSFAINRLLFWIVSVVCNNIKEALLLGCSLKPLVSVLITKQMDLINRDVYRCDAIDSDKATIVIDILCCFCFSCWLFWPD